MRWEYIGTGLALIGIGVTLMLALPPPGWPKMPTSYIHVGIICGVGLTVAGFVILAAGIWPQIFAYKQALSLGSAGLFFLIAAIFSFNWTEHRIAEGLSIETSLINLPGYARFSALDRNGDKDPPMLGVRDVFIRNTSETRSITLKIFLTLKNLPEDDKPGERLQMKLEGTGKDAVGRRVGTNDWATDLLKRTLGEEAAKRFILSPLTLKPQETVNGSLAFILPFTWELNKAQLEFLVGKLMKERVHYMLIFQDALTGREISIELPGRYSGGAD